MSAMRHIIIAIVILLVVSGVAADPITADQALAAVARFAGLPVGDLAIRGHASPQEAAHFGPCYKVGLRDDSGMWTTYYVRVTDGTVVQVWDCRPEDAPDDGYDHLMGGEKKLPVSVEQAEEVARAFASRHYEGFAHRRWFLFPDEWGFGGVRQGPGYEFQWHEVLSDACALAPWPLIVAVSGYTGRVTWYCAPPDRPVLVPVRPRISRSQAVALARRFLGYPASTVPCRYAFCQVVEDVVGIQALCWVVEVQGDHAMVDAIAGEFVGIAGRLGAVATHRNRHSSQISLAPTVRFPAGGTKAFASFVSPVVRDGTLLLRAEHLRAVDGLQVAVTKDAVTVVSPDRTISGRDLGATWRDYGWWVPLRKVAGLMGWRVDWNNEKKEAVVHTNR